MPKHPVFSPLQYNGAFYAAGSEVELDAAHVEELSQLKVIGPALADPEAPPPSTTTTGARPRKAATTGKADAAGPPAETPPEP